MKKVDMIVKTKYMYTMEGEGTGFNYEKAIVINDGKIIDIINNDKINNAYSSKKIIDANDKLVLPGFIDGHMHTQHAIVRGVAQDIKSWMMHGVGPFELNKTEKSKYLGSKLAIYEAVMNGTTTIGDDGFEMENVCKIIDEIGVRGNVSVRVRDAIDRVYSKDELYDYDKNLGIKNIEEFERLYNKWNGHDSNRIQIRIGPQGPDFVGKENLLIVKEIADKLDTKIHMHLQQGSRETNQMIMRYGERSIPWLDKINYFDKNFIGIHLTNAMKSEINLIVERGISMVLCSGSIGIIDGIVPPAYEFQEMKGFVGLGSDQAAGNNCHDIINEMKLTALFNKIKFGNPEIMPSWKVLRMATIEGAKALGIDKITGSLEIGKYADIIMIDLKSLSMQPIMIEPMRNFIPNLVYSASRNDVDTVIVSGKIIVESKKPVTFKIGKLLEEVSEEAKNIGNKSSEMFWKINGPNAVYMSEGKL